MSGWFVGGISVEPRAVSICILEPAFKERLWLSRAPQAHNIPFPLHPLDWLLLILVWVLQQKPNPSFLDFSWWCSQGTQRWGALRARTSHFSSLSVCVAGKAKETPVPAENKEDLGLFVIKAVCISLRKSKVWCPLGSICKAFSQQTFSHHRQMPSVLQLGANGFCTANFTAVSNAVIEEARGISYNKTI